MQTLKEDIRSNIIKAGAHLFKDKGFEHTSMKDIAKDAGVSTGNIYRYFLTKKHLIHEILTEIEKETMKFLENIPVSYSQIDHGKLLKMLNEEAVKLAEEKGEALDVMFNCNDQMLYLTFKDRILNALTDKVEKIMDNMQNIKFDKTICKAIATSLFDGFVYIVKEDSKDIEKLRRNLDIYTKIMIVELDDRIKAVGNN